jgi:hypothetical protein
MPSRQRRLRRWMGLSASNVVTPRGRTAKRHSSRDRIIGPVAGSKSAVIVSKDFFKVKGETEFFTRVDLPLMVHTRSRAHTIEFGARRNTHTRRTHKKLLNKQ